MAATVTVIQPQAGWGSLVVTDARRSHYVVQWEPPAQFPEGCEFHAISVYCHACQGTVLRSTSNPAVFDLTQLEESGHPGPFDIQATLTAYWELWLRTWPANANQGSTTPTSAERTDIPVGTSVTNTIEATPKPGYEFDHWECPDRPGWSSTEARLTIRTTWSYPDVVMRDYIAYFRQQTTLVTLGVEYNHIPGGTGANALYSREDPNNEGVRLIYEGTWGSASYHLVATATRQGRYTRGSTPTFTLTINPYGVSKGYRLLGWYIGSTSTGVYVKTSGSLTYTLPDVSSITISCHISDGGVVLRVISDTSAYGYAVISSGSERSLPPLNGESKIGDHGERIEIREYIVAPGVELKLHIYYNSQRKKDGFAGGYHGFKLGDTVYERAWTPFPGDRSGWIKESVVVPSDAADIIDLVVFMCSHALIHNDDSGQLEYRNSNNQLVYECYAE